MSNLKSPNEVLALIGAQDFRSITKDQLIQFASNMQNMEPEVAIECIKQMPAFKEQSTTIVKYFYDLCNTELKSNSSEAIEQYKAIIVDLQKQLRKKKIEESERQFIIEQIVYVADKIDAVEQRKDQHKRTVLQYAGVVGSFAIAAALAVLGGKFEIPFKKNR